MSRLEAGLGGWVRMSSSEFSRFDGGAASAGTTTVRPISTYTTLRDVTACSPVRLGARHREDERESWTRKAVISPNPTSGRCEQRLACLAQDSGTERERTGTLLPGAISLKRTRAVAESDAAPTTACASHSAVAPTARRPRADRAYDELRASGMCLCQTDLYDRDALTPGERRTAHVAACGMTNREVARSLYPATELVELRLSRV